jgi:hypothetical protein
MNAKKYSLEEMLPEHHKEINDCCLTSDNINISIDEYQNIRINTWNENHHNGDHCDECKFEIEAPIWLCHVLEKTSAYSISNELRTINHHMQRTFDSLIVLNKLLEKK